MQTFTFLCLAVAVICGMFNYLMLGTLNWFWFASAGCFCAWLVVHVAYLKRRNILKNEMWQLLIITVLCVLWDHFTGMAWLVDRLRISIRSTGSPGFDPCDRKDQPSGKRRISVLSDTIRRYRMYSCNPDRSRPHYLHLAVCIKCRDQLSDAGRFVYFSEKDMLREFRKKLRI